MRNILQKGFILPATIMIGLGIAIMSTAFLQTTSNTSVDLNNGNFNALAEEAARAGITYANSCIEGNSTQWPSPLTPSTSCNGGSLGVGASPYITSNSEYRTTFSVANPTPSGDFLTIVSTGTVQQLDSSGNPVRTFTKHSKTTLPNVITTLPVATGNPITEIKNNEAGCAVANGELYCWGHNQNGVIGDGTTTSRGNPTRVQHALAGKTITSLSVGTHNVCVTADGLPYCWGRGSDWQLGQTPGDPSYNIFNPTPYNNSIQNRYVPTADVPLISSGPLNGYYVPDVDISDRIDPSGGAWPFATATPHTSALRADGAVASWGDGRFRQNTAGACFIFCDYPDYSSPRLIDGYSNNDPPFVGKKAEKIGISSHDSCFSGIGRIYCAGVEVPLDISCNSVLFSGAWQTVVPGNPCVHAFSPGYDMSGKTNWLTGYSALDDKFIDVETFEVSTNTGCAMADTDFVCVGTRAGTGFLWFGSWLLPWVELANVDITSHDNGENRDSAGWDGMYCVIDRGTPRCRGSTWLGGGGVWTWDPINSSGYTGKVPTKIAAGEQHGCIVANGQLYCWGNGSYGVLADGDTSVDNLWPYSHSRVHAALSGTGGSTPIGTNEGTYAADGAIAVGDGHSCGVTNGRLYCWGRNDYGQLGLGNTTEVYQPVAPASTANWVFKELSAGAHHTCGLRDGQLYCWGRNNNGQLGLGYTSAYVSTPTQVPAFSGMRVYEVSAGDTGTCAVANGQAYCWGLNSNQQLGTGDTTTYDEPQPVDGGSNPLNGKYVRRISLGATHACAVANGDLYCWGNNANGRTGLNTTTGFSHPTLVTGGTAGSPLGPNNMRPLASWVSAGSDFTCAVLNSMVSCWGNNANGRTGRSGVTTGNTLIPTAISSTYFGTEVTAGGSHACALLHGNNSKVNGNLWCWGNGTSGRVGNNQSSGNFSNPVVLNGGDMDETNYGNAEVKSTISVSAGSASSCAVVKGNIQCWGSGANGRLGNAGTASALQPGITSDYRLFSPFQKGPIY